MSESYVLGGSVVSLLRTDQQTVGAFCLMHITKPGGFGTQTHAHSLEWEAIYILSGELLVEVDGAVRLLGRGDLQAFPAGVPHRLSNPSAEAARYLLFCAPAGFDDFVREVGEPRPPNAIATKIPSPAELQRLREAAPRHGIALLPESALRTPRGGPRPLQRQRINALGIQVDVLAERDDFGYGSALLQATLPPYITIPLHTHTCPELFYLSSGRLDLYRFADGVGRWTALTPGCVAEVSTGVAHALRNPSSSPAEAVIVSTRSRLEFLRAIACPPDAISPPPTPEQVSRLLDRANQVAYWTGRVGTEINSDVRLN